MNELSIFPEYKAAVEWIIESGEVTFSDDDLATMMHTTTEENAFRFGMLKLKKHLLDEHGIDFIRVKDRDTGFRGHKIATSAESLHLTVSKLSARVRNAANKQRTVLTTIDRNVLIDSDQRSFDKNIAKNGLLLSFIDKTRRMVMPKTITLNTEVPRMIG